MAESPMNDLLRIRIATQDRALLQAASTALGKSESGFVREAAGEVAARILTETPAVLKRAADQAARQAMGVRKVFKEAADAAAEAALTKRPIGPVPR